MSNWLPMDAAQSQTQIESVLDLLGDASLSIIDAGCGDGRLLLPMAVAGHHVTGIDIDREAINACATKCAEADVDATLLDGDMLDLLPTEKLVDVIVCCGQTLMLVAEINEAVEFMQACRKSLKDSGMMIIDDIPNDLWPEVVEGRWVEGINEAKSIQLVWAKDDIVFAIRQGDEVDPDSWELKPADQPLRLWTKGSLTLIAALASLSAPEVRVAGAIQILRAI